MFSNASALRANYPLQSTAFVTKLVFLLTFLTVFSFIKSPFAQTDHERFCKSYAQVAVADEKENERRGCYKDWVVHSLKEHFDWCLSQNREVAEQQAANRRVMMNRCPG